MAEKKGQLWNLSVESAKKEYVSIKELAQGSCDGKTVRMEAWFMP